MRAAACTRIRSSPGATSRSGTKPTAICAMSAARMKVHTVTMGWRRAHALLSQLARASRSRAKAIACPSSVLTIAGPSAAGHSCVAVRLITTWRTSSARSTAVEIHSSGQEMTCGVAIRCITLLGGRLMVAPGRRRRACLPRRCSA